MFAVFVRLSTPVSEVAGRRQLYTFGYSRHHLTVLSYRLNTFRPLAFSVAGPIPWYSLPARLHESTLSSNSFTKRLKTEIFEILNIMWRSKDTSRLCAITIKKNHYLD